MSKYADKKFWTDAGDRAIASTAQAAVAALGTGATGLLQVDALGVASVALLAGAASLLTSIAFRGGATNGEAA